ncbi:MAG: glycosyl transferase group 1 [Gemmatimonadetes bacterium]|nr:glycosyl transferase group 1 [Gemmatimonadota bacterium]
MPAAPPSPRARAAAGPKAVGARSLLVDARGLRKSGIGRYLREVLGGALADPRFGRLTLLGNPGELRDFLAERGTPDHARVVPFAHGFYSAAANVHWAAPRMRGIVHADAAFFPHYDVPLWPVARNAVVCVQDLSHFKLPELFPAWKRALGSVVLARAVAGAARVVVPSESSRADLVERCPAAAGKTEVIPHGASPPLAVESGEPGGAVRVAGVPLTSLRPYLLCVGNRKPHKNFRTAVSALARLRRDDPSLRLVIAGQRFPEGDGVAEEAAALGIGHAVVEAGVVSEHELGALYAGAECLLVPSLYEGFGLTPLEAMLAGVPVVASCRASVPEVVGDAGLLVDPLDADAVAEAVRSLRGRPELRAELVRRGRERAARFTWRAAVERTLDLLHRAAGTPAGA